MTEGFGARLREYRAGAKLTGKQLVRGLQAAGHPHYSPSDVSKWEHGRIPPEDVVEDLEEIPSTPRGALLRAAGYRGAGEYLRIVAGEQPEGVDSGKVSALQRQQMEHIGSLQQLARSAIESWPESHLISPGTAAYDPNYAWHDYFEKVRSLYLELVNDAYWPSLAAHLGDESKRIEHMTNRIATQSTNIPREELSLHVDKLATASREASDLLSGGLAVVAWYGDTREWERRGLKPRCPFCPTESVTDSNTRL